MRNITIVLAILLFAGMAGCSGVLNSDDATTQFMIETIAIEIGYEMRNDFTWTETVDNYYTAIMEGKVTIDGAQAAEAYLKTVFHPVVANRLVKLAKLVGFDLSDVGSIAGIDNVDIALLQCAASGFKIGLNLVQPAASVGIDNGGVTLLPDYMINPMAEDDEDIILFFNNAAVYPITDDDWDVTFPCYDILN